MNIDKHSSKAHSRFDRVRQGGRLTKLLPSVFCAALLAGCAHRYDMTLTNGARITNVSKPEFHRDEGAFYYKDVTGKVHHVNSGHVVEITPHSGKNTTPGTVQ
jgi:Bacterial protein of unknown function (DUF903)